MSTKLENAFRDHTTGELSATDVALFLERHPDFLNERPELLEALTPPSTRSGRRVLDMQRYMVERLQRSLRDLRAREAELISTTRANRSSTGRVHAAVLALCEPFALDNLVEIISNDLPTLLETDVVVIAVEAQQERVGPLRSTPGVCLIAPGSVEKFIGAARDVVLISAPGPEAELFGGAAALVKSMALLRLKLGRPGRPALVALGSRDAARFAPGQGTETLAFLAEALGRRMREWLDCAL